MPKPKKRVSACYYCKKPLRASKGYVTYFTGYISKIEGFPPNYVEDEKALTCPECYVKIGYKITRKGKEVSSDGNNPKL